MKTRNLAVCLAVASILGLACPLLTHAAGVAIVVDAKSPVAGLTSEQASQLFLVKSATLPDGTRAVLIDQEEGSHVREEFYTKVTGKNAAQMKALWSRIVFSGAAQQPKSVAGDAAVKKAVVGMPGNIGYIDKASVDASVKVLLSVD